MYEMSRVRTADSGINTEIYVSTENSVKKRHGPRIKVSNIRHTFSEFDNFAVTIDKIQPRVIAGKVKIKSSEVDDICDWVRLNYTPLMKYWRDEYSTMRDFYGEIISLRSPV
jgi:hypothetical protein